MNYEEVLKIHEEYNSSCDSCGESGTEQCDKCAEAHKLITVAIEKQMPKKTIFTEHILIKGCNPSVMRSCPNCKRFFDVTMIGDDFCKRCGQALDWE